MNSAFRTIGRQHRTARTLLRVGQIADRAGEHIGSVHMDKHPVGAIAQRALRTVAAAAPKAAFLASQSENIQREGKELVAGLKSRNLMRAGAAGIKLGAIGKMAYHTKTIHVEPKMKTQAVAGGPPASRSAWE